MPMERLAPWVPEVPAYSEEVMPASTAAITITSATEKVCELVAQRVRTTDSAPRAEAQVSSDRDAATPFHRC